MFFNLWGFTTLTSVLPNFYQAVDDRIVLINPYSSRLLVQEENKVRRLKNYRLHSQANSWQSKEPCYLQRSNKHRFMWFDEISLEIFWLWPCAQTNVPERLCSHQLFPLIWLPSEDYLCVFLVIYYLPVLKWGGWITYWKIYLLFRPLRIVCKRNRRQDFLYKISQRIFYAFKNAIARYSLLPFKSRLFHHYN